MWAWLPSIPCPSGRAGQSGACCLHRGVPPRRRLGGRDRNHGKARPPLGLDAIHPVTGQPVPIYAANFVLMGYGTGAVMSVPAHDERDYHFARKYGIPIKPVIVPEAWEIENVSDHRFGETVAVAPNLPPR